MTQRVEKIQFQNQSAWKKRPEIARSNIYVGLHKVFGPLLPTVFKPTGSAGGIQGLLDEAARLKVFSAASIPVPEVLEIGDDFIILSDAGKPLPNLIQGNPDSKIILEKACEALANLHSLGLVHGRPHLKDMTLDEDGYVYLLDLEEDPLKVMTLKEAQARDIWLFLCSVFRICGCSQPELKELFDHYQHHLAPALDKEIEALSRKIRPYLRIVEWIGPSRFGRDVSSAYWATKILD